MNLVINFHKKKLTRMEIDKMEKFVFFKLWHHDTYCKVISVCLQNKRFGKVYINQKWGSHQRRLQILKGIISFNSSRKRLILPNQSSKKGHYSRIVGNETLIKVSKYKKTLDILNRNWSNIVHYGLNLTQIHVNAISKDDVP
jgi:hypothetical protein